MYNTQRTMHNVQRVRSGVVPRPPQPPERQKPRAGGSTAKKNPPVDDATLNRLRSHQLHINALNNQIVELQKENESIKVENRTLRQVRPFLLQLGFKVNSPTFTLYVTFMRKLLAPSYRCVFVVSNKNHRFHDAGSSASAAQD